MATLSDRVRRLEDMRPATEAMDALLQRDGITPERCAKVIREAVIGLRQIVDEGRGNAPIVQTGRPSGLSTACDELAMLEDALRVIEATIEPEAHHGVLN